MALSYAALGNLEQTIVHLEQSLLMDFRPKIIMDSGFDAIRDTDEFVGLVQKYTPNFNIWSFMYFYVALIGFYTASIIQFNKKIDQVAKIMIGIFIFIHSFFIFHICFNITNYQYVYPHSYLMSTAFSLLYGPLLYFYFKRITQRYSFKKRDILHLVPTLLLLFYLVPIYSMSADEKLDTMLNRVENGLNAADASYVSVIVLAKLISLIIYGYFVWKLYWASAHTKELGKTNKIWQRNFYTIHLLYIISYAFYGFLVTNHMSSGFFYHSQIVCMSLMVIFLGFSVNVQPSVFSGLVTYKNQLFYKYEKSGLTESLSKELMQNLKHLFDDQKIYKENDLNLETLADRLNTTRHNASQVVNEHFGMNFNELINTYRIREAKYILETDKKKNLNMIDIAYEVGFNNKVSFNKAFKKDTQLTPSEYQRTFIPVNL
ncbi:MAG: AraC family transcriptional regulator [Flavobacteriales bacterium]|nr:MAG: AraC family transcriptional regulator [Flavobacteriales bacterium]